MILKKLKMQLPQLNKNNLMQIGEIAKQSGFSKDTLRYYEKIGLIQLTKQQRGCLLYTSDAADE